MELPVYIPYVNRPDLLLKAVQSLGKYAAKVVVIDNSENQDVETKVPGTDVFKPCVPLSFTQSQNWMMKTSDIYIWMHVDAEASEDAYEKLCAKVEEVKDTKWGVIYMRYDIFSAVNGKAGRELGGYDNVFMDYSSDVDFYHRLDLAGLKRINLGHPDIKHVGSQTIKSDVVLGIKNAFMGSSRHDYYLKKWGGPGGFEVYKTPFNLL